MTELRTTRSATRHRLRLVGQGMAFALGIGGVLIGITGCGQESRESTDNPAAVEAALATDRPMMSLLAAPRSEWIDYSPPNRKLTLYDLPASGRWMVKRSDLPLAYPIGPEHILPEGIDPKETVIYYIRPGGQTSRSITLAQIQSAHREHVSLRAP